MKVVIAIVMGISLYLAGPVCQAIVAIDSPASSTSIPSSSVSVSTEVRTIIAVKGGILETSEGDLPLDKNFRACLRKGGRVIEQKDLSRLAGRKGRVHVVNGKVVWIVLEAEEGNK